MFSVPTFVVPFLFPPAGSVDCTSAFEFQSQKVSIFLPSLLGGRLPRHFNEGSFWGWGPLIWNLTSSTPEKNLNLSCYSYIHVHWTFRFIQSSHSLLGCSWLVQEIYKIGRFGSAQKLELPAQSLLRIDWRGQKPLTQNPGRPLVPGASTVLQYPSSQNYGSVENGCISNIRFLSTRVIFHWTMIMGERVTKKGFRWSMWCKKTIWEEHSWSYHLPSNVTDPGFLKGVAKCGTIKKKQQAASA